MSSSMRLPQLESDPVLGANVVPRRSTAGLFSLDVTKVTLGTQNTKQIIQGEENKWNRQPKRQKTSQVALLKCLNSCPRVKLIARRRRLLHNSWPRQRPLPLPLPLVQPVEPG